MKKDMIEGPFYSYSSAETAAREIKDRDENLKGLHPKIMLVLGSGCGEVAENIETVAEIPYKNIPYMSESTVEGHKGVLKVGKYNGIDVLGFQGRNHYYEGHSAQDASFMVYLGKHLGAEVVIMTSAGGIAPKFGSTLTDKGRYPAQPNDLLLVKTVFPNYLPSSLRGPTLKEIGPRFNGTMDMPTMYLNLLAEEVAVNEGIDLGKCAYVPRQGPNYETPLEVSLLSHLSSIAGLPVVGGMSLVPELEAANMLRMKSLAIAVVTNKMFDMESRASMENDILHSLNYNLLDGDKAAYSFAEINAKIEEMKQKNQPSHEEVTETAGSKTVTEKLETLIGGLVKAIRF